MIRIGVATLSIGREFADRFPAEGTGLERYAARLNCTEINSSFYRPHQRKTYERWAQTAPASFRFSVKLPKAITHERRLMNVDDLLHSFLEQASGLGDKMGPLLIQLPPSLKFDGDAATGFFETLRAQFKGELAVEARHATWFEKDADALLISAKAARVLADPAKIIEAENFGGWTGLAYARLHGSPRMYFSPYEAPFLQGLTERIKMTNAAQTWVIFDNTASGAALGDALAFQKMLESDSA